VRILVTGSRFFEPAWPPYTGPLCAALDDAAHALGGREIVLVHGQCNPREPSGERDSVPWYRAMDCGVHPDRLLGADWQAYRWAIGRRWAVEPHPADWREHGRKAGFVRNAAMVELGADVVVAALAPGEECKGTRMCAGLAKKAGIRVVWVGGNA
jgi:hypothetical protein